MEDNILDEIMYRSEEPYGSGVRDIIDIMVYEIFELGNVDILDYTLEHYIQDETLQNEISNIIEDVTAFNINEIERICKDIIDEINAQTGHDLKYALWLAEYNVVENMYGHNIDAYKISDIILSDLGIDGILFAYDEMPEPIKE